MIKALSKFRTILILSSTVGLVIVGIVLFMISRNGGLPGFFAQANFVPNTLNSLGLYNKEPEIVEGYVRLNRSKTVALKPTAEAYLVADLATGEILLEKNKDKIFPIASISKIMTATVAIELQKPEQIASVSQRALNSYLGQNGGLTLNEKFKNATLLYPILLVSSNNATEVIAEGEGREKFMKAMNDKAKDIGLKNTSFEDPSGLSKRNLSTSTDLFKLAQYVKINHPEIFEVTKLQKYTYEKHTWFSNSQFLGVPEYEGGKSGYTDPAMQTMLSTFKVKFQGGRERNIAIVVLRSSDRRSDVLKILNYVKSNFDYGLLADISKNKSAVTVDTPPPETEQVKIGFVGDIMLDRGVKRSVEENMDGDYSQLFKNMASLKDNDIQFANLSGPASDKGEDNMNLYSFRMPPETLPILKSSGFDVLSIANNHIGDWGKVAFEDTLIRLRENEIGYTGGGVNSTEAEMPFIIEKNGLKVGFLGFSDVGPNSMKVGTNTSGILLADNPRVPEIIRTASGKVDILAVSFNFGEQYETKHSDRQEYLAHLAIDSGAKIVVGTHPHVIQDSELYHGGFIAYSLGNFIFDQSFSTDTMKGMMLEITAGKNGIESVTQKTFSINKLFQPDKVISKVFKKIKDHAGPVITPAEIAPLSSGIINLSRIFSRSEMKTSKVAITIDDGWDPEYVKKAIDILNSKKEVATFFPVGEAVSADPRIWKKALDAGIELGNHTLSHKWSTDLSGPEIDIEVSGWQTALDLALGYHYKTRWIRLPGMTPAIEGNDRQIYKKITDTYKLDIALWNIDTETGIYKQKGLNVSPEEVSKYILGKVKSGDIIMLHFIKPDIDALALIIDGIKRKGLELVTLSEMISPAPEFLATKSN